MMRAVVMSTGTAFGGGNAPGGTVKSACVIRSRYTVSGKYSESPRNTVRFTTVTALPISSALVTHWHVMGRRYHAAGLVGGTPPRMLGSQCKCVEPMPRRHQI